MTAEAARASARITSTSGSSSRRAGGGSRVSRPTTRSTRGSEARRAATRVPRKRLTPVTTTTLGGEVTTDAPSDAAKAACAGTAGLNSSRGPGRPSLAETATLDAGLTQQLAVLLLRHTLAALLDHGAHTNCLSKPGGSDRERSSASRFRSGRHPGARDRREAARAKPGTNRTSVPAGQGRTKTALPDLRPSARTRREGTRAPRAREPGTNGRPGPRSGRRREPTDRRSSSKPASGRPPRPRS